MKIRITLRPEPRLLVNKRRIGLHENLDLMIIKCVTFFSPHIGSHGKSQEMYKRDIYIFIGECELDNNNIQITWKTVYDRLNRVMGGRKESRMKEEQR